MKSYDIQGNTVFIDDEDIYLMEKYNWRVWEGSRGLKYLIADTGGRRELLHRIICNTPKNLFTDHINGNGLDNRRSNLRVCTNGQNQANSRIKKNNRSGYKGVVQTYQNKWVAKINKDKKRVHLGTFTNPQDAARAYNDAAREAHGQFARLNEV